MHLLITTITLIVFALLGGTAIAQEQEESYIYTTYYHCDPTREERADELVEAIDKPIYEAAIKAGDISGWGYLVHHTGGTWRRAQYHRAGSVVEALDALDKLGEARQDSDERNEIGEICNSHDDYIWRGITGSGGNVLSSERGKVGLSVYYVCDNREAAADEIVKTTIAPVYNANVGKGKLASWGYAEHIVGGKYRRLATMTAADWPSLFEARAAIIEAIGDNPLGQAYSAICDSHSDYLWEIRHEAP